MDLGTKSHVSLQLDLKLSWPVEQDSEEVGNGYEDKSRCGLNGRRVFGDFNDCCDEMKLLRRCGEGGGREGRRERKKLRLTREQACYLEECFIDHNTLNPKQKFAIAKRLNLEPRQVEVWFQNRRARTKLKQTEADYEYLKQCCDHLTEQNRRLRREIQDLRALKSPQQNCGANESQATALMIVCPSCKRAAVQQRKLISGVDWT